MSSTYTPSDVYSATVTLPDDGDPLTAASINTPLQALADNTKALRIRTPIAVYHVAAGGDTTPGVPDTTPLTLIKAVTSSSWTKIDGLEIIIPRLSLLEGDAIEVEASMTVRNGGIDGSSDGHRVAIDITGDKTSAVGTSYVPAGCFTHIDVPSPRKQHVTLHGRLAYVPWDPSGLAQDAAVRVCARTVVGVAEQVDVCGGASLTVKVYR